MHQAFAYLESQLGNATLGKELAANSLFWSWWRNHWHDLDLEFVDDCKKMSMSERREYYEIVHDLSGFEYKPHRAIMLDALKSKHKPEIKHLLTND